MNAYKLLLKSLDINVLFFCNKETFLLNLNGSVSTKQRVIRITENYVPASHVRF
jgi:hypothetical protein